MLNFEMPEVEVKCTSTSDGCFKWQPFVNGYPVNSKLFFETADQAVAFAQGFYYHKYLVTPRNLSIDDF